MKVSFAERYEGVTGSAIRQIFALLADPEIISFAGGNPAPVTFPSEALSEIAARLIREEGASILQYGGTAGVPGYLAQVKGLFEAEGLHPADNELISLTGSSQGIDLMTKAVVNPGDVVLVESPTFLGALQTFKLYQAELQGVQMDEQGMVMEDLEEKLKTYHPKFVYTIPTFQNPTGRTLPADRRRKMVELCSKYGCLILEDDPYASLRYAGQAQPSIKSFDTDGIVVKLLSFSKTISPGLRVGAAYAAPEIIHKFNLGKQGQDVHTANLNQAMVAEYIKSGAYPEGIARNIAYYRGKMETMVEMAKTVFPAGTQVVAPEGGMFLWVELPEGCDATAAFGKAVENKVAYVPGTHFYHDGGHNNTMRLNFTMVDEERIKAGMERLGKLFE